jgi:hypothetical protein
MDSPLLLPSNQISKRRQRQMTFLAMLCGQSE